MKRLLGLLVIGFAAGAAVGAEPPCTETQGPTRALGLFKPGEPVSLEEGFAAPTPISRVQCWWQCHGSAFTRAEITRQLEQFRDKGMGGVTVKDTLAMPRTPETEHIEDIAFMSEKWLDMFAHIVSECERLGLICRSRLGSGWNAGGPWVTPAMSSQEMRFAPSENLEGPRRFEGVIPRDDEGNPTNELLGSNNVFVLGVREDEDTVVNLTSRIGEDGFLTWNVPEGTWRVLSCFMAPSGIELLSASPSGHGLHHDHLSEAGTDLQLRKVARPMLNTLGGFEDTAFDGFNVDSWELGKPTWTPGFRRKFIKRRGYDPVPYLPVLAKVKQDRFHGAKAEPGISEKGRRFLFDMRTTVSDLIVETHYRRVSDWCRAQGVPLEAEAGGGPGHGLPKDFIKAQGAVDIPMGEFWMRGRSYVKIASSAAHAYGKRLVALESFTETQNHFAIAPSAMKRRADEAFLLGGNYFTAAVVEYSPKEAGRPGWVHNAGPHLNHTQTWWPFARPFFDYLARCSFMLQSGRDVADVAVYYTFRTGETSIWAAPADDDLSKRSKAFAFDYVNDELIQQHMRAENGRLVMNSGASYQMLYIIPTPEPTMPLETMRAILQLTKQGATVAWAGKKPDRCPGLTDFPKCDEAMKTTADALWVQRTFTHFKTHDYDQLVPLLEAGPYPPSWSTRDDQPLRFVHRRTHDADIFFVVNRADWPVTTPVLFRVADRTPQAWDPVSGEITAVAYKITSDGAHVTVELPAYGSVFIVFRESPASAQPKPKYADEIVTVNGPWTLSFPESRGAPEMVELDVLRSWTKFEQADIKHFSGIATYTTEFELSAQPPEQAALDLGSVREVCQVALNGTPAGIAWHAPYRIDVSGLLVEGRNTLEIRVANLWHNRIVGDAELTPAQRVSRIVPETHYEAMKGKGLVTSGLLGPVHILAASTGN
ncbi:MAG: glycosyl hydrolase [Candidatus Hydrogenedentota bacterium]